MIIVQLKGGLGNQLFQYAAGLSLAKHHDVPIKADVNELKQPDDQIGTFRTFELEHLVSPPTIANQNEIDAIVKQNIFIKYFQKFRPSFQRDIYNEKQFHFDKNFFNSGNNIYLKGYRQSEKYFAPISSHVRKAFQLKPGLTARVAGFATEVSNKESVSIHIRRGDYTNTVVNNYHGVASEVYYQQAINEINAAIKHPSFYIFSDNIDWVKQHLQFGKTAKLVSKNISKNHYEDFYLMQHCRHNIIANSSFSWWAAWLNPNPDKIVIAPERWFNNAPYDTRDLIPPEWIKL